MNHIENPCLSFGKGFYCFTESAHYLIIVFIGEFHESINKHILIYPSSQSYKLANTEAVSRNEATGDRCRMLQVLMAGFWITS